MAKIICCYNSHEVLCGGYIQSVCLCCRCTGPGFGLHVKYPLFLSDFHETRIFSTDDSFGGLVVSMLASSTQVRGFKPDRNRWIFTGPGFGLHVKYPLFLSDFHETQIFSTDDGFGGLVVSMLASGTQVRGFKPDRNRWIFTGVKILSMPSSGGEVKESVPCPSFAACKRT